MLTRLAKRISPSALPRSVSTAWSPQRRARPQRRPPLWSAETLKNHLLRNPSMSLTRLGCRTHLGASHPRALSHVMETKPTCLALATQQRARRTTLPRGKTAMSVPGISLPQQSRTTRLKTRKKRWTKRMRMMLTPRFAARRSCERGWPRCPAAWGCLVCLASRSLADRRQLCPRRRSRPRRRVLQDGPRTPRSPLRQPQGRPQCP